jgi:diaminopimelate epimerase
MSAGSGGHRPTAGLRYYKGHGLGNDYLVFEEGEDWTLDPEAVAHVCDRWRGPGGDGIVLLMHGASGGYFRLRMFNPDGSEFERSGNGLRILASHLARTGRVGFEPFVVEVGGDHVSMTIHARSGPLYDVSVEMGRARVGPEAVALDPSALDGEGRLAGPDGTPLAVVPVSVGNPHLVVWVDDPSTEALARIGPFLTAHPALAHGANVQLAALDGARACRALIWERGVGPTSASGTSSCAVAVAAVSRGLMEPGPIDIHMEGGTLRVDVSPELEVVLRGPVEEVCEGEITSAWARTLAG